MNYYILTLFLFLSSLTFSQKATIEGNVLDASEENAPILFANVTLKESGESITTGYKGGYFFKNLKPGNYTLIFNFLGYQTFTKKIRIKANEKTRIDALLKPSTDISFEPLELSSK